MEIKMWDEQGIIGKHKIKKKNQVGKKNPQHKKRKRLHTE